MLLSIHIYSYNMLYLLLAISISGCLAQSNVLQNYKSFHYIGCVNDNAHPLPDCSNNNSPPAARTLRHFVGRSSDMTIESCLDQCLDGGFTLGGLEAGDECCIINYFGLETVEYLTWPLDCGNALLYQTLSEDVLACETPCAGNSSEICGGSQLLSVYQNGDIPFTTGPAQQIFHYNDWSWNGCMEDAPWFREIPTLLDIPPYQMSIELCLDTGEAAGYNVCALQYGQECWCGNVTLPAGESVDTDCCNIACNDNAGEICGGSMLNWVFFLPSASFY